MENVNQFLNYDWGYVFFGLVLLIVVVVFILDKVDGLLNRLGITTKKQIEKEKNLERIVKLEQHDKWQYEKLAEIYNGINTIQSGLSVLEKENDMRRIKDLKAEILAFSRSLKRFESDNMSDDFDEEDFDHIFECFIEYEDLLEKYKMKNGKTVRAMTLINKHSMASGYGEIEI